MAADEISALVPYELDSAHKLLIAAIDKADAEYASSRHFKGGKLCAAIERFVDEVCRVPGGADEFGRRAGFIDEATAAGSPFRRALADALAAFRSHANDPHGPRNPAVEFEVDCLQSMPADERILYLGAITKLRERIERGIEWGFIGHDVRPAFETLLAECVSIQREAERLEVDGCRFLWCEKVFFKPGTSLAYSAIKPIRFAADALLAWVRGHVRAELQNIGEPGIHATQPSGVAAADERNWVTVREAASASGANPGVISRAADAGVIATNGRSGRERRLDAASVTLWMLSRAKRPEPGESGAAVRRKLSQADDN